MGKAKLNIPMCAALVLLFLTMLSIHLTSGLYARYTATSTASDSARVAKFDVTAVVQPVDGKEGEFTLTVTNNSEVAVEYSIEISLSDALSVTVDGTKKVPASGASSVSFTNDSWKLAPNAENPAAHTLQFDVENWEGRTVSDKDNGETEPVSFGFTVNVTAQQID